ncbi:hypothetical protein [Prevotella jejuni]
MKKKYFSPTINVYNIVEAETILAGSGNQPELVPSVNEFGDGGTEDLDGE